jgi:WD40 repeat protein
MVASGGLDCSVILWSVEHPQKHFILQSAHTQSQITGVSWLDNATLVSAGHDANVKVWNVTWSPN